MKFFSFQPVGQLLLLSFPVFSAHAAVVFIFLRISTTDVDIVFATPECRCVCVCLCECVGVCPGSCYS